MNPLNDDELNELLRRAKAGAPHSSSRFKRRVMQAYRAETGQASLWQRLTGGLDAARPFRLPNLLAAVVLILVGAVADRTLLAARIAVGTPKTPESIVERVVYKDCPAPSQGPGLTFNELQPVREIKPRVVRSIEDDQ